MNTLDIKLLGKEYRLACPPDERESLQAAVQMLDQRLSETAGKTRSTGERLAVMTALHLAHELLARENSSGGVSLVLDSPDLKRRITAMEARLDEALSEQKNSF